MAQGVKPLTFLVLVTMAFGVSPSCSVVAELWFRCAATSGFGQKGGCILENVALHYYSFTLIFTRGSTHHFFINLIV
jgi:hypothetical protein